MQSFVHGEVAHFEITGDDTTKLGTFYGELFGWSINHKGPGYALVETHGSAPNGAVVEAEARSITIGIAVRNLSETLKRAKASGGEIVMPETDNGWVKKAQIADPSGNIVTIIEL